MIYVVVFAFSPQGGTAAEQAGTARLSILHLSQSAFQLVPQTTQKNPSREKKDPLPPKKERERGIYSVSVLYGKKVNKSEIHREAQNNTKQNRALKKARGDESREVKCGIKNGPPCAQGKLSAPTPQDSTDNSPSARETQALLVDRTASIV